MSVPRWAASIAAATVLVGGSLTVAAVALPNLVGAQDDPPAESTTTGPTTTEPGPDASGDHAWSSGDTPLRSVLDDLVADGTLTQGQADAVLDGVASARDERRGEWQDRAKEARTEALDTLAGILGLPAEEVSDALGSGSTIGELIEQQGLDRAAVVDEIVAAVAARVDEAVAEGQLPAGVADRVEEHAAELVDRLIDEDLPWGLMQNFLDGRGPGALREMLGRGR